MLQLKISINKKEKTMKNFKKVLIVTIVAALVLAGCVIAAFASDEYKGTIEELTTLVEKAETSSGDAKYTALEAVYAYLKNTPVDPAAEGYDALLERVYKVNLDGITQSLSFASVATVDADAAYKGLFRAQDYFTLADEHLPEDYAGIAEAKVAYDEALVKAANALLLKVDTNITTTLKTATNKVAINKVRRVLTSGNPFGEVNLNDIWGTLYGLEQLHEKAVAANYNAIEDNNAISDYDLPIYYELQNFEKAAAGNVVKDGEMPNVPGWSFATKGTSNPLGIGKESNGNQYMYTGYAPTDMTDKNTYVQLSLSKYKPDNGYVMEFDITTFDNIPEKGYKVEAGGFNMTDGRGFPPFYLTITANGDLVMGDAPNAVDQNKVTALPNAIVPGQWLHCVIVFNYSEFTYTLIVDGEELSTTSAKYKGNSFNLSEGVIRFGTGDCVTGSVAVDNFVLYSGSGYRNPEKFTSMSDDEKFIYYTNYLGRDSQDVNGKNYAYEAATKLISNYWTWTDQEAGEGNYTEYALANAQIKAAVDNYLEFDLEELLVVVRADNLKAFIDYVVALDEIERSTDNISDRGTKILEIEAFVLKYADLIDKVADSDEDGICDYDEYNRIVARITNEKNFDQNAVLFIRHMDRFQQVTALSSMQRYYERAKAIVEAEEVSGRLDMDLLSNPEHPDRANFEALINAYNAYLAAYDTIDEMIKKDNSAKIINCMGFIDDYTTEEEWLANYDYMNKYINLVSETIFGRELDGGLLYDPEYKNVSEAVEFFYTVYEFFYNVQQDRHVEYISNLIELIASTEAYIEKMGMVAMIDRYVASNDLNYNDARIVSLMNALETCRSELEVREEDYAKILVQNAVYFINVVENMRTSSSYSEKKSYFNKATEYYFNLDITVAGAAEAVVVYDECAIELALAEESSLMFLDAIANYKKCENADEKYAALVDCYYNAQYAETSYEGVADALEYFESEYDSYMDYAEEVNGDVAAAGMAIGSLRANCGVTTIIAVIIKKIFGV